MRWWWRLRRDGGEPPLTGVSRDNSYQPGKQLSGLESLLCDQRQVISTDSEDSDQTRQMSNLIQVFPGSTRLFNDFVMPLLILYLS